MHFSIMLHTIKSGWSIIYIEGSKVMISQTIVFLSLNISAFCSFTVFAKVFSLQRVKCMSELSMEGWMDKLKVICLNFFLSWENEIFRQQLRNSNEILNCIKVSSKLYQILQHILDEKFHLSKRVHLFPAESG